METLIGIQPGEAPLGYLEKFLCSGIGQALEQAPQGSGGVT